MPRETPSQDAVPWRERIVGSIAKSRKVRGGNYVQLATVDAQGKPRVRTVVFRGFAPDGSLKMITDARSAKMAESSAAEICWWFSQSSEQYRFAGELARVTADESDPTRTALRKEQWGQLSDQAREQFFWQNPPRAPFDATPESPPTGGRDAETSKVLPVPETFVLVLLEPTEVDFLRLTDNFRQMDEATRDAVTGELAWRVERVNP